MADGTDASATSGTLSSSLLARVKDRDSDAWSRLVTLYGPLVYRWARQAGLQASDAADVVQNVFVAVSKDIARFRRDGPNQGFRRWLRAIARNRVYDHFRGVAGEPQAVGGTDAHRNLQQLADFPLDDDPNDSAEIDQLRLRAVELLRGEFKDNVWQAFWRVAIEGDQPAHVADDLGISVWAVYKARTRVLHRLNQELKDLQD